MFGRDFMSSLFSFSKPEPKEEPPVWTLPRDQIIERDRERCRQEFGDRWEKEFDLYAGGQYRAALAHYRGEVRASVPGQKLEVARTFGADEKWEEQVKADADRAIREIDKGHDAHMRDWSAPPVSVFTYDFYKFTPQTDTVMDVRHASRADILSFERSRVEVARRAARERRAEEERVAKLQAALARLERPVPLVGSPTGIIFGSDVTDGSDFELPVNQIQHMLVAGATGSGKSVFLHQIISQLVKSDDVHGLILIDLKGGVEFNRYRTAPKVAVVWEFSDVVRVVDQIVETMDKRQEHMRLKGLQNWPGGRVFVVIDEYAEIQSDVDGADTREEKAIAKRLAGNLVRIARRARSLGIVLVCALQKPTTDAMDSALRTNLNCRICLRVGSKQLAASVLDDLEDLPVEPTNLPRGRYIYYDPAAGVRRYVQTQIAPGVDLGACA